MKKSVKILISFMLGIVITCSIAGCGLGKQDRSRDPVKELCGDFVGAYFLTDASYERYVRNCAEQVGADNKWVLDVLNVGDGDEWHYMVRPQSWFWCVIANNQINVSNIVETVYDISVGENEYIGSSITDTISFWFKGDILCLNYNGKTMEYKKDNSYQRVETGDKILSAPKDVTVFGGGDGLCFAEFHWNYQSDYGTVGAAVEVKKAGSDEYETLNKIERVYMNMLVMQLDETQFEVGENLVRIYHICGPSITNDKKIILEKNSAYATYRVIVNDNGSVVVKNK